jgi:hypothetical protein
MKSADDGNDLMLPVAALGENAPGRDRRPYFARANPGRIAQPIHPDLVPHYCWNMSRDSRAEPFAGTRTRVLQKRDRITQF